jgi:hypothetical protein
MTDSKKGKDDPTKDPKFRQVIDHFLTTPPKPHTPKEVGRSDKKPQKKDSARK